MTQCECGVAAAVGYCSGAGRGLFCIPELFTRHSDDWSLFFKPNNSSLLTSKAAAAKDKVPESGC